MKPTAQRMVSPIQNRNLPKSLSLSDAQDITMVTEEKMRTRVLSVAKGTESPISRPCGQTGAPVRSRM